MCASAFVTVPAAECLFQVLQAVYDCLDSR
jgi:hypothetical protein